MADLLFRDYMLVYIKINKIKNYFNQIINVIYSILSMILEKDRFYSLSILVIKSNLILQLFLIIFVLILYSWIEIIILVLT
jgi:hypothetical protein